MLTVVDRMPWSILSVLFGRDIDVMTKMHGDVYTNVPFPEHTYVL